MNERVWGFTIVLDREVGAEHAKKVCEAFAMMSGVARVEPISEAVMERRPYEPPAILESLDFSAGEVSPEFREAVQQAAGALGASRKHEALEAIKESLWEPAPEGNPLAGMERGITVYGKYRFYLRPGDHRIYVQRYGEGWMVMELGHKAILALMQEVESLRDRLFHLGQPVSAKGDGEL